MHLIDQDKTFLGTEPVGKLLLNLAMPQFIADKTTGVYTAEPVADIIAVCFAAVMFSVEFKKAMRALDAKAAKPA